MQLRWKRSWAVFGALLAGALIAAGCGSDDDGGDVSAGTGDTTAAATTAAKGAESVSPMAFFGVGSANAFVQTAFDAAKAEANALGIEIELFDGQFDGAAQNKQIQDAITSGKFKSFVIQANDQAGVAPIVEEAISKGIKVAAFDFPLGPDPTTPEPQIEGLVTTVNEDVAKGAETTGEAIIEVCEDIDPCKVGLLWGARGVSYEAAKVPVLEETLAGQSNIEVVAQQDAGWLRPDGRKAAEDMLQANPDLNVIATASGDQMIIGAQQAIEAAGKEPGVGPGKIALIGYGGGATAVERVRSGDWYQTYVIAAQTMAKAVVKALDDAANGRPVEDGVNQWELSTIGPVATQETLEANPGWRAEWDG